MKRVLPILILFIGMLSCSSGSAESKSTMETSSMQVSSSTSAKKIYYRFPSPNDIINYLEKTNLEYRPNLPNTTGNVESYITSYQQALNLGIYVADLAYITIFTNINQALDYFDVVENLAYKIKISNAFNERMKERIKNNLSKMDSLNIIAVDAYNIMVSHLINTDNEKTLAVISAGAYIETIYLALNQLGEFNPEDPVLEKVFEQKYAFENLILYMEEFNHDKKLVELTTKMNVIKDIFNKTIQSSPKTKTKVINESDGSLTFSGGGYQLQLTEDNITELTTAVNNLRNGFVDAL